MVVDSIDRESNIVEGYSHARYESRRRALRFLLRYVGFTLLAKLSSVEGLENVPTSGPAILMINHIAFIDPIVVLHVAERNIVPLAKREVLDIPVFSIFPKLWGVIPVRREEIDRSAVKQVQDVLRSGEIVLVAPEGTRSPQLQQGKVGIAYLASRALVPIVPVAIDGTIGFPTLRFNARWHEPGAQVKFGQAFRYRSEFQHAGRDQLRLMTDEAMYVLAGLLPEYRRGEYNDLRQATQETIEWV